MKTIMKWLKDLTRVKHPRKLKLQSWDWYMTLLAIILIAISVEAFVKGNWYEKEGFAEIT